jgi:hypothetical protein
MKLLQVLTCITFVLTACGGTTSPQETTFQPEITIYPTQTRDSTVTPLPTPTLLPTATASVAIQATAELPTTQPVLNETLPVNAESTQESCPSEEVQRFIIRLEPLLDQIGDLGSQISDYQNTDILVALRRELEQVVEGPLATLDYPACATRLWQVTDIYAKSYIEIARAKVKGDKSHELRAVRLVIASLDQLGAERVNLSKISGVPQWW